MQAPKTYSPELCCYIPLLKLKNLLKVSWGREQASGSVLVKAGLQVLASQPRLPALWCTQLTSPSLMSSAVLPSSRRTSRGPRKEASQHQRAWQQSTHLTKLHPGIRALSGAAQNDHLCVFTEIQVEIDTHHINHIIFLELLCNLEVTRREKLKYLSYTRI